MKRALLALALLLPGCIVVLHDGAVHVVAGERSTEETAASQITASGLLAHIQVLSSDDFEGRGPGTRGEEKTVDYLTRQLVAIGLEPGNPDGTWVQAVPLVGFTAEPQGSFAAGGRTIELAFPKDCVALTRRFVPEVDVRDSEIVFVGYGVVAAEYGWDDYKDVDVRGKTIVMLVNDPAVPDPEDPTKVDESTFRGRAMTYYGRWTYKYEIAAEKGAAAALIVHEEGPAGYPWSVVEKSWGRENFDIDTPDRNMGRAAVEAWIHIDKARELLAACGQDLDALKKSACSRDFRPVALGARANLHVRNMLRNVTSHNVVAKRTGRDRALRAETVVYTAHWDHLGRSDTLPGDGIFNGAVDNASGSAGLLELAGAFADLPEPPRRTILLLWVTAEEKGLLGSKYYAAHPLVPLERTLADVNMDGLNTWGRTSDMISVGLGQSTLDDVLAEEAGKDGRRVAPDAEPEKGYFYRSDHFEFAKVGVPALDADSGIEYLGRPPGWGKQKRDDYTAHDYHQPSDEVKPDWDLSGAVLDLRLLFRVGLRVADGARWPEWKDGSEFKARREAMLRARGSP